MGLREAERIFKVISRPVYSLRGAVSVIRSLRSIAFDDCEIDRFDQTSPKYAQNLCIFFSGNRLCPSVVPFAIISTSIILCLLILFFYFLAIAVRRILEFAVI